MTTKSLKQATRQYPTPALEKGLDILKLFASESGGLSKSDVARRLGRTVSEIFRNAFVSRRARLHLVPFLQRIGDQTTPATVREVLQKASMLLSESITAEAAS